MEDIFTSSLPSHHFSGSNLDPRTFGQTELDPFAAGAGNVVGGPPRRSNHRHHSNSSGSGGGGGNFGYDRSARLQGENDYLKERVRAFEKGMGKMYQVVLKARKNAENPPTFNHKRSASLSYQYESGHSHSPSPIPESGYNGYGMEFDEAFNAVPQLSMSELLSSVEKLVSDRDRLLSEVDDLRQITDAAKRERVLAIDEKDQLLRESHTLRVTTESLQSALKDTEETRDRLALKVRNLKEELVSVKRDNERANELRSLAMEERLKIIAECSELQQELRAFQSERDDLYKETQQQQSLLDELSEEKRKLEQDLDWLSKNAGGVAVAGGGSGNGCSFEARGSGGYEAGPVMTRGNSGSSGGGSKDERQSYDVLEVNLKRSGPTMPWGFTFEGGRGNEFYHQDSSIVITGLANHTPSAHMLRFGDRILKFGDKEFRNVTRKEAAEVIRSCDLTAIIVEIGRAHANIKPAPLEVRIPGKRDFGFSYESRLFVTSTEEESQASDFLLPGDEILQVQGKSAFNMKPSALKQLLKSCKDGVILTVQRQPGINVSSIRSSKTRFSSSPGGGRVRMRDGSGSSLQPLGGGGVGGGRGSVQPSSHNRLSCEFVTSPGTPKSSISESSAGYHSLTHSSLPGDSSHLVIPVGPDSKTGQIGPEQVGESPSTTPTSGPSINSPSNLHHGTTRPRYYSDSNDTAGVLHHHGNNGEGYGPRPESSVGGATTTSSSASSSSNGFSRSSYRNRPSDFYSRSPRRNTTSNLQSSRARASASLLPKSRTYSMTTSYRSVPNIHPDHAHHYSAQHQRISTPISPGLRPITSAAGMGGANSSSSKAFSMSADNLDSDPCVVPSTSAPPVTTTHVNLQPPSTKEVRGHLTTPTSYSRAGILSVSMSNMQTHV